MIGTVNIKVITILIILIPIISFSQQKFNDIRFKNDGTKWAYELTPYFTSEDYKMANSISGPEFTSKSYKDFVNKSRIRIDSVLKSVPFEKDIHEMLTGFIPLQRRPDNNVHIELSERLENYTIWHPDNIDFSITRTYYIDLNKLGNLNINGYLKTIINMPLKEVFIVPDIFRGDFNSRFDEFTNDMVESNLWGFYATDKFKQKILEIGKLKLSADDRALLIYIVSFKLMNFNSLHSVSPEIISLILNTLEELKISNHPLRIQRSIGLVKLLIHLQPYSLKKVIVENLEYLMRISIQYSKQYKLFQNKNPRFSEECLYVIVYDYYSKVGSIGETKEYINHALHFLTLEKDSTVKHHYKTAILKLCLRNKYLSNLLNIKYDDRIDVFIALYLNTFLRNDIFSSYYVLGYSRDVEDLKTYLNLLSFNSLLDRDLTILELSSILSFRFQYENPHPISKTTYSSLKIIYIYSELSGHIDFKPHISQIENVTGADSFANFWPFDVSEARNKYIENSFFSRPINLWKNEFYSFGDLEISVFLQNRIRHYIKINNLDSAKKILGLLDSFISLNGKDIDMELDIGDKYYSSLNDLKRLSTEIETREKDKIKFQNMLAIISAIFILIMAIWIFLLRIRALRQKRKAQLLEKEAVWSEIKATLLSHASQQIPHISKKVLLQVGLQLLNNSDSHTSKKQLIALSDFIDKFYKYLLENKFNLFREIELVKMVVDLIYPSKYDGRIASDRIHFKDKNIVSEKIPTLIVFNLIYNSYEHGRIAEQSVNGSVRIKIQINDKKFSISVIDNGNGSKKKQGEKEISTGLSWITSIIEKNSWVIETWYSGFRRDNKPGFEVSFTTITQ